MSIFVMLSQTLAVISDYDDRRIFIPSDFFQISDEIP